MQFERHCTFIFIEENNYVKQINLDHELLQRFMDEDETLFRFIFITHNRICLLTTANRLLLLEYFIDHVFFISLFNYIK